MSGLAMGLDLSLRRTAIAVVRSGRRKSNLFDNAHVVVIEGGERIGTPRIAYIVGEIRKEVVAEVVTDAFVEQHAFSMGKGSYALERAELVGAVKYMLLTDFGIEAVPVVASSARKLLFGKLPRMASKEIKRFVVNEFRKMGAPESWKDDECDAMAIVNYGRGELGLPVWSVG
jgi:hypothetical protein